MASLFKNVAGQNVTFAMVTTAGAADAAATVTARVTKDAVQAAGAGTVTNLGAGQYNYAPTQAETNATDVGLFFTATGDVPVNLDFHTDAPLVNALPPVDVESWKGTTVATPATAGVPDINAKNINNVATTSVTVVSGNLGTTQPVNFTGTGASALVQGDTRDWLGVAVTADASGLPAVDMTRVANTLQTARDVGGQLDAAVSSRSTLTQAQILSDATPFAGANINATIGSRSTLTQAQILSDATPFAGATVLSSANWTNARAAALDNVLAWKIKKNTALNNFAFLMVQSTDHITPATGLTVTLQRSLDGAAFANSTNAPAEIGNGVYKINLAATDLAADIVVLKATATGADQRTIVIATEP
jgi:hypothetical protein